MSEIIAKRKDINQRIRKVKLNAIDRIDELKRKGDYKSPLEWEEYHLLKHKFCSHYGRGIKK